MLRKAINLVTAASLLASFAACAPEVPQPDADVIVIGGGIAGLSAALEASEAGARVVVLEMNSVPGGHAVMAGGLFLVGTPLQEKRGVEDSVELAFSDIMTWGEDSDPEWVRRYVEASRPEVHDWLAGFGVEFNLLLPAPGETSVPRFHFARGGAVNVVVPMMVEANARDAIELRASQEVIGLDAQDRGAVVRVRDLREGTEQELYAPAVVIATGGFESDLERVRANWPAGIRQPERLLAGASRFARGSGLELGEAAGAAIERLDHQTIFVTGFPDPRDPDGERGLLAMNAASLFINAQGERFVNEGASRKVLEQVVLESAVQTYWMLFDEQGRKQLQVRGAPWLTRETLATEILGNPELVRQAESLDVLAESIGVPAASLNGTVQRFNALVAAGIDEDFGRFGPDSPRRVPKAIGEPPFYALKRYPMTRKSMGGLVIDGRAQLLDTSGSALPGLFAAGEVTGVAGINGSWGGSGTFLGPSILTGRIAGRSAAEAALTAAQTRQGPSGPAGERPADLALEKAADPDAWRYLEADDLVWMLEITRPGYWHFEVAHELVLEQARDCAQCHGPSWPTRTAQTRKEKRAQLESCTRCH
jgi:predicted oxidoreductase